MFKASQWLNIIIKYYFLGSRNEVSTISHFSKFHIAESECSGPVLGNFFGTMEAVRIPLFVYLT